MWRRPESTISIVLLGSFLLLILYTVVVARPEIAAKREATRKAEVESCDGIYLRGVTVDKNGANAGGVHTNPSHCLTRKMIQDLLK